MKFLCDQCKAKYQIADEKVAGKTVRMKCRKCGHMIEVKSEVTETSVAGALPPSDATKVGAVDPAGMMHVTAPRPPGAPRPGAPPAPRAPASKLATSLAGTRPSPASKPPAAAARPESALAGAFQKSVQKEEALLQIATNAEWYVAINGVPVGPIRLTELRRKAASGAITDDSLCWQDGMEEWRPLKSVTELSAIVHEALASGRPSLASPAPVDSHPSLTPAPPQRYEPSRPNAPHGQAQRGTPGPSRAEPSKPLAPAARSNVVSLSSRLATAERLEVDDYPEDHTVVGDPFAALAPEPSANALPLVSPAHAAVTSQPIATTAPAFRFSEAPPPPKKAPNWIAIAMIVLAGAFGITAAIALFVRPPPAVAIVPTAVVTGVAPPPTAPTNTGVATAEPTAAPMTSSSGEVRVATGSNTGGGGTKPAGTATVKPAGAGDIASLLGGPTTGPNVGGGGGGGGGGGSALSQEAIEGVVRSRTPGVKRTCWERGGGTESNVNVTVKLVIASSGGVSSATATGNDPIVTKCIENQTRAWQFPASNGSTNVDIPFHFLRQ